MEQQLINNERFVLPGETVKIENAMMNQNNFYEEGGQSKSYYFGLINVQDVGKKYVDIIKKATTYMPEKNHFVIGIVKNRVGENVIIDINAPLDGVLGGLQFDGATKRNKPTLNPGDLVYARISEFSKYIGAKLSCINTGFSAKNVLGELKGGTIVYGLSGKQKKIEQKLEIIKKFCQFQIAFGKNDILWFTCSQPKTQMILYNIFTSLLKGCTEQLFQTLIKMLQP